MTAVGLSPAFEASLGFFDPSHSAYLRQRLSLLIFLEKNGYATGGEYKGGG
jgi:hypothetical protein